MIFVFTHKRISIVFVAFAFAMSLLSCAGTARAEAQLANIGPVHVNFGSVKRGARVTVPITIRNPNLFALAVAGGGIAAPFSGNAGSCGGSIPAVTSCAFEYSFRPSAAAGTVSSEATTLQVSGAGRVYSVVLSFTGESSENLVQFSPVSINFGEWPIGQQVNVPVTITNTHDSAVTFAGGGFTNPGFFGSGGGGTCSGSLASGSSCEFNFSFTPGALGTSSNATGILVSATGASAGIEQLFPVSVEGTGIGTIPLVGAAPVSVDFGSVTVGRRAAAAFRFTNLNAQTINLGGGGLSPGSDGDGSMSGQNGGGAGCGSGTASPGATCTNNYFFRPRLPGEFIGSTMIVFSQGSTTQVVPYTFAGEGVGSLARITPLDFDVGRVAIGSSLSVPVTITNTSDAPLTGFIGGGVTFPFISTTTCTGSLAVGASCSWTYTFSSQYEFSDLRASVGRQTLISFTNATGIQPSFTITMSGTRGDRIFGDAFDLTL
jgi:hypothetical protein